uniref:F-box domain-containing protein n=1 Tax=Caenorhabditis tropicalis TaxID=1561998 RepID=A0A1I7ULZ0_9PELO
MDLLRFPYLVQKEILKNLKKAELFLLSLCSLRTTRMIQRVGGGGAKIERICYFIVETTCYVNQKEKSCSNEETIMRIQNIYSSDTTNKRLEEINILGVKAYIEIPHSPGSKICVLNEKPDGPILEAIHKQLGLIFGNHLEYSIYTNENSQGKLLPILGNIKNSVIGISDSSRIYCLFQMSPYQESVKILPPIVGCLPPKSGFFNSNTLKMSNSEWMAHDILNYFNGKRAFLKNAFILNTNIIQFLQKWISNEKYQNLEVLSIDLMDPWSLNGKEIMNHFDFNQWNELEDIEIKHGNGDLYDLDSPTYIMRDFDRARATIAIEKNRFFFAKWNTNEA